MTGFGLYHSYVIMNVTNRNQSLLKSEIRPYFIRLTICQHLAEIVTCPFKVLRWCIHQRWVVAWGNRPGLVKIFNWNSYFVLIQNQQYENHSVRSHGELVFLFIYFSCFKFDMLCFMEFILINWMNVVTEKTTTMEGKCVAVWIHYSWLVWCIKCEQI